MNIEEKSKQVPLFGKIRMTVDLEAASFVAEKEDKPYSCTRPNTWIAARPVPYSLRVWDHSDTQNTSFGIKVMEEEYTAL